MKRTVGKLEVITGSMFSGKSEELIRRLRRTTYARQKLLVFSPSIDNRYGENGIYSHDKSNFKAYSINDIDQMTKILDQNPDVEVIGIDEIQFFPQGVVDFCIKCVNLGIRVVVAGLDLDFKAKPFEPLPRLMAIADDVSKLSAICMVCGNKAYASQRLINGNPAYEDDPLVSIGSVEQYEARCRLHHIVKKRDEVERNIKVIINLDQIDLSKYFKEEIYTLNNKSVNEIREEVFKYTGEYIVEIRNSISDKIQGNYKIIDYLLEISKISKITVAFNNEKSINEIIIINDLLDRCELKISEIYSFNKKISTDKIEYNTGITVRSVEL